MKDQYCIQYRHADGKIKRISSNFDTKEQAREWLKEEGHDKDTNYSIVPSSELKEGYQPLSLLKEMLDLTEAKKVPLKKAAKSVYHRDYVKTKNKPYRKYDPKDYQKSKGE